MSPEFWLQAERFYEFWLMLIIAIIVILLSMLILAYTYTRKENRKKLVVGMLSIAAVFGLIGFVGHTRYSSYLGPATHVNPLMRDRVPTFTGYTYVGRNELGYYTNLNDLEALREMPIYEEKPVIETVAYLGEGKHTHYFEHENGLRFRFRRTLDFSDEVDEAKLTGSRFYLKDEAFEEIGFINPENIMFDRIIVPSSEEGKTFTPENEADFMQIENVIDDWNF